MPFAIYFNLSSEQNFNSDYEKEDLILFTQQGTETYVCAGYLKCWC